VHVQLAQTDCTSTAPPKPAVRVAKNRRTYSSEMCDVRFRRWKCCAHQYRFLIRRRKTEEPRRKASASETTGSSTGERLEAVAPGGVAVFRALRHGPCGTEAFQLCLKLARRVEADASLAPSGVWLGRRKGCLRIPLLNLKLQDAVLARKAPPVWSFRSSCAATRWNGSGRLRSPKRAAVPTRGMVIFAGRAWETVGFSICSRCWPPT